MDTDCWHIVSRVSGKHIGPFSSEVDCALARSIARPEWADGIAMDAAAFDLHLSEIADVRNELDLSKIADTRRKTRGH